MRCHFHEFHFKLPGEWNNLNISRYSPVTVNSLKCTLNKPFIDYFMASLLISGPPGRSTSPPSFATTDDRVYNFQTYGLIESISPQNGSVNGGSLIKIRGKYLVDSRSPPTEIDISGSPCLVVETNGADPSKSEITCVTSPRPANGAVNEYPGNRGVNLIMDTSAVYTTLGKVNRFSNFLRHFIKNQMALYNRKVKN